MGIATIVAELYSTYASCLLLLGACINWRKSGSPAGGSCYAPAYFHSHILDFEFSIKKLVDPYIGKRLMRLTTCYGCGKDEDDEKNSPLTLDHVVPRNGHGKDSAENAALLCNRCNASKNNRDLLVWWAKKNKYLDDLNLDVLIVYVRNMYRLLAEEGRLDDEAPAGIKFLIGCFALSLPTTAHAEAFLQIGVSVVGAARLNP